MLKNIVVLASQAQEQLAVASLLKAHNPGLSFIPASATADLALIAPEVLADARLISFASGAIVPPEILSALGHGAYNFHPGSPAYPGWAPAHFALYEQAKSFGATAHLMTKRVDEGPIVGTETFIVPYEISIRELEQVAYIRLAYLFWRLAKELATNPQQLHSLPIEWGKVKSTRRMYASLCDISIDISADELHRRMASFDDNFRAIFPTVTLHGVRFRAERQPITNNTIPGPPISQPTDNAVVDFRKRA